MRVAVTGASGFIGSHLCEALSRQGHAVRELVRHPRGRSSEHLIDIVSESDPAVWQGALAGMDAVIHLAGVAHTGLNADDSAEDYFEQVNVTASSRLMREAIDAGVTRFIFLSSIKAAGERSVLSVDGQPVPLKADDMPRPIDLYGQSKLRAENALNVLATGTGTTLTVLRPPLVYGPGQKGNLASLYRIVARGWPLPLAAIDNRRSLISVNNLSDAIVKVLIHLGNAGGVYHLADVTISTPELIRAIALSLQKPARLFAVPTPVLRLLAIITGKRGVSDRLLGSLVVESELFSERFDWQPEVSFTAALEQIAKSQGL